MKTNFRKSMVLGTAVLTLMLLGTACSGGTKDSASGSPSAGATDSASPSGGSAAATESASESPSAAPDVLSGEFNGTIDGHTIEIKTGMGPLAYQVSPEIADKVSKWDPGTKVKYSYKENTITSIDKE